ncbi:MAG TPA: TetR/AcrR family transcriptional regulator [Candidatus Humimicrobiaceae bacterium]
MKQEERKRHTISNILKAATECFEKKGYENTLVTDICRKAGITKGGFYHHFKSKQDLFLKLLDDWIKKVSVRINISEFESDDLYQALISIPKKLQPVFEENKSLLPLFLEIYLKSIKDRRLKKVVLKSMSMYMDFFGYIINVSIKKGVIKKVNPDDVSKILFALTIGLLMQGLMDPDATDWGELATKSLVMLLK